jgi:hypothetical protein
LRPVTATTFKAGTYVSVPVPRGAGCPPVKARVPNSIPRPLLLAKVANARARGRAALDRKQMRAVAERIVREEELRAANRKVGSANAAAAVATAGANADAAGDEAAAVAAAAAVFAACEPMRRELALVSERERVASVVALLAKQIRAARAAQLDCTAAVGQVRERYARLLAIDAELQNLYEDAEPPPPAAAP